MTPGDPCRDRVRGSLRLPQAATRSAATFVGHGKRDGLRTRAPGRRRRPASRLAATPLELCTRGSGDTPQLLHPHKKHICVPKQQGGDQRLSLGPKGVPYLLCSSLGAAGWSFMSRRRTIIPELQVRPGSLPCGPPSFTRVCGGRAGGGKGTKPTPASQKERHDGLKGRADPAGHAQARVHGLQPPKAVHGLTAEPLPLALLEAAWEF